MKPDHTIMQELEYKCRSKNIPFSVVIELTYHCNLSCKHCYIVEARRPELSYEKLKDILDTLVDMGTFSLCLTGGEIFTRSDCLDIITYAHKKGFSLVLLTNGTLITREIADFLKDIKLKAFEISLLGASSETHDSITGVPGSFEKALDAIKLLKERGILVVTKTTLMHDNIKEYKQIKELSIRMGAVSKISAGIVPKKDGSRQPQQLLINRQNREYYLDGEELNESFIADSDESPRGSLLCRAGKMLAAINPYGDVSPCILMPITLGNLCEKSFPDIWYNPENSTLRELRSLTTDDLDTCSTCSLSSLCQRCAGAAYLETKSLRGRSSIACEEAWWKNHVLSKKQQSAGT